MLAEAVGIGLCLLLWGTRAYLAAKYVVKSRIGREVSAGMEAGNA